MVLLALCVTSAYGLGQEDEIRGIKSLNRKYRNMTMWNLGKNRKNAKNESPTPISSNAEPDVAKPNPNKLSAQMASFNPDPNADAVTLEEKHTEILKLRTFAVNLTFGVFMYNSVPQLLP